MDLLNFKHQLIRILSVAFVAVFLLSACSSSDQPPFPDNELENAAPVEELFKEAQDALDEGLYRTAAQKFDDIERIYPFSVWAKRAMLMSAFAYYENEDYDRALIGLERFIRLYPVDERTDYAYYLKAMCYYEQISDIRRDQKMTEMALSNLMAVIDRFPESQYARDARLKIDLTFDHLAGKEMEIGRYYMKQKIYNAAIRRFQKVVREYQTTTHVAEALYRLVEANMALGLKEEAKKNAAILGHNYPGSAWYEDAYVLVNEGEVNSEGGFFSKAWHSVVN
ncbi:MAG: outer membrane protein assembly factor BamD [Rickettsiales bacterium]|nr:outer membrane protein assembly factor BamD [Rickettsiales bacterium]